MEKNMKKIEHCKLTMKVKVTSDSLWPHGLYSPWNSPGQNTGEGSLSLLQGIFPTQGSNPGLPHCRWILYQLSYKGSPRILEWVAYPFFSQSSWPRNWTGISCIAGRFFTNWAINYTSIKKEQFFIENKHFLQGIKKKEKKTLWNGKNYLHIMYLIRV